MSHGNSFLHALLCKFMVYNATTLSTIFQL